MERCVNVSETTGDPPSSLHVAPSYPPYLDAEDVTLLASMAEHW